MSLRLVAGIVIVLQTGCNPAAVGGDAPPPQDVEGSRTRTVVDGSEFSGYPAVALLQPNTCTGTLIAPRAVLTAAHCVDNASSVWFDTGLVRKRQVVEAIKHPDYVHQTLENDIAILHLDHPVTIAPVPVAGPPIPDQQIEVVGFGRTGGDTSDSETKRMGINQVGEVRATTFLFKHLPNPTNGMVSVCYGDSGGPSFNQAGAIIGIHSGINTPAGWESSGLDVCANYLSIDTSVQPYIPWIMKHMIPSTPATPMTSDCPDIPVAGCCAGDTLWFCVDAMQENQPCANGCGWNPAQGRYTCGGSGPEPSGTHPLQCPASLTSTPPSTTPPPAPPPSSTDSCGGITSSGCCQGSTLYYCLQGVLQTVQCQSTCGWKSSAAYYDCGGSGADPGGTPLTCPVVDGSPPPPPPPPPPDDQGGSDTCGGITFEGCCSGQTVFYCDNGQLMQIACASTCGWKGTLYDCGGEGSDPSGQYPLSCP